MSNRTPRIIRPQDGYQMKALASSADILIGGGAAGVGKTFSLLLEPLRHKENPNFGAVCFRRTSPQIRNQGGLWDTSMSLYPFAGGRPKETVLEWQFPTGSRVSFKHLQHENDKFEWQGSQIPLLMFDELTHFSESTFFYMLSRNRSDCGIAPYVRATCNPDPESWVAKLIDWWIDPKTGYPIPEREGVVRFFAKHGDSYIWGNSKSEVIEAAWYFLEPLVTKSGQKAEDFVKSITFISGSIYDNKALLTVDSGYLANLAAQDEQTRMQLLDGNWKVVISDLDIYDYAPFAGLFSNIRSVNETGRYITADIAGMGSDKFVVGAWHGRKLADIVTLDKSDGPKVVQTIANMATRHEVPNHHIAYDADGIGGMYTGFAPGAIAFNNGATALPDPISPQKDPRTGAIKPENYENLKTQCYYRSGQRVADGSMSVGEEVANQMYDTKMSIRQRFMHERKAIKRDKPDDNGKLRIIPKKQMKVILGGESPDLMDMFCMREIFDLKAKPRVAAVW